MKVLIISHMFPSSFNEIAGIFVYEQIEALIKKGVEIRVISPVPWAPFPMNRLSLKWKRYSAIPNDRNWEGILVQYPRYLTFPRAWFFESSGKRMYQGVKKTVTEIYRDFKFDLIHAHTLIPDGYTGTLLQKSMGIPCIVTIHGSDLLLYPYKNKKSFSNTSKVLKDATKIITVSSALKKRCRDEYSISDEKIKIIYNGYNDKLFRLVTGDSSQKKISDQKITILFIGHIMKTKGVFDLLNAIPLIDKINRDLSKKCSWVIIGEGPGMKEFKKRLSRLNNTVDIRILGQLPHNELSRRMKTADFVILPAWSEGLSVTLLEAMASGVPVISTKVGGIPEIVTQESGILVDPKNPEMLARGVLAALSKNWDRKRISEKAKKFTWEESAGNTVQTYQEVLEHVR